MKNILLGAILLFSMLSCTQEDSWNGPTPYCLTITGKFTTVTCQYKNENGCVGYKDIKYILILSNNNTVCVTKQQYDTYNLGNNYCIYN